MMPGCDPYLGPVPTLTIDEARAVAEVLDAHVLASDELQADVQDDLRTAQRRLRAAVDAPASWREPHP